MTEVPGKSSEARAGKVVWGIISTASIATAKVVPAMLKSDLIKVAAIASRDLSPAREWAGKLGIPKAYGAYEEMLDDPEIEAVYNPLPNHLHVSMTIAAAARGKHVLCEKPVAMTAAEAATLASAPEGVLIGEGFMVRHHPQWRKVRALIEGGEIGAPRAVHAHFSSSIDDPKNLRNIAEFGGGSLYDLGCYAIVAGRYCFGAEPVRMISLVERDPALGTDRATSALIDFGEGRHLTFTVSTRMAPFQRVSVHGTTGRIEIEVPITPPPGEPARIRLQRAAKPAGAWTTIELPLADQYRLQAEAFSRAVRGEEPLEFGVADAVLQMRVIDAAFRSEKSGRWERP